MLEILTVIGARPQFIKHAAMDLASKSVDGIHLYTVHTGQHYDKQMSDIFFDELKMSRPDVILNIGSHNHGKQTGLMMIALEEIITERKPDAVMVYGDTNSTLAGALVASKLHIPVIHIEAGLRSFNMTMPEEINRILTDHVSTLLFPPSQLAVEQLRKEDIKEKVFVSGDVMYDLILRAQKIVKAPDIDYPYYLATIHRPYNTDNMDRLLEILKQFQDFDSKVKFPAHPRTMNLLKEHKIELLSYPNIEFLEPQSYFGMIALLKGCLGLVTDSGGMQKEAYWMKKKCVTLRSETEWVETLQNDWNTLVFDNLDDIKTAFRKIPGDYKENIYGDGNAAAEILGIIKNNLS